MRIVCTFITEIAKKFSKSHNRKLNREENALLDGSEAKMNFALQNMWNILDGCQVVWKSRINQSRAFFLCLVFSIDLCSPLFAVVLSLLPPIAIVFLFQANCLFLVSVNSNIIRHEWTLYKVMSKKKEGKNSRKHVELIGY